MAGLLVQNVSASGGAQRTLMDRVTLITSRKAPLLGMIPKSKQSTPGMLDEWPADVEDTVEDSAQIDNTGGTVASSGQEQYGTMKNRVQWNRKVARVSKLSGFQNQAGVGAAATKKMAYAIVKKLKAMANDMEATLCSEREAVEGTTELANKTRGAAKFLTTGQTGTYAVPTRFSLGASQIYSGALASFGETDFNALLKATYDAGAIEPQATFTGLCGSAFKARITTLTAYASGTNTYASSRTYNADLSKKIIYSTIDEFRGDFGTVALIPTRWLYNSAFGGTATLAANSCLGLTMDYWEMVPLETDAIEELPFDGGGQSKQISSVWTLRCLNPMANWVARCAS